MARPHGAMGATRAGLEGPRPIVWYRRLGEARRRSQPRACAQRPFSAPRDGSHEAGSQPLRVTASGALLAGGYPCGAAPGRSGPPRRARVYRAPGSP